MKRSPLRRKTPLKRTGFIKRTNGSSNEEKAFMARFCGLPCAISGRTRVLGIPTVGHHILPKSVFPEYRLEEKNMIPLDCAWHQWAHEKPLDFLKWLESNIPEQFKWVEEHRHHRSN